MHMITTYPTVCARKVAWITHALSTHLHVRVSKSLPLDRSVFAFQPQSDQTIQHVCTTCSDLNADSRAHPLAQYLRPAEYANIFITCSFLDKWRTVWGIVICSKKYWQLCMHWWIQNVKMWSNYNSIYVIKTHKRDKDTTCHVFFVSTTFVFNLKEWIFVDICGYFHVPQKIRICSSENMQTYWHYCTSRKLKLHNKRQFWITHSELCLK